MKESSEIIAYLALRMGYLYYHKPLMYAETGAGVDLLLYAYHELWAEVVNRRDDFLKAYWQVSRDADPEINAGFRTIFQMTHPHASEEEITAYVVAQWRKISDRLGVPIQHEALRREFAKSAANNWPA